MKWPVLLALGLSGDLIRDRKIHPGHWPSFGPIAVQEFGFRLRLGLPNKPLAALLRPRFEKGPLISASPVARTVGRGTQTLFTPLKGNKTIITLFGMALAYIIIVS